MRITVIGCAGSFPGPDSPASCYLVEASGFRLLLDLGNGALGALQRHAALGDIDAVVLSHLHGDHCLDMCAYAVVRRYAPGGPMPPLTVYGPAGTAQRLEQAQGVNLGSGIGDVFAFETLVPGTRQIGPFEVTAEHVNHPVETFGFRLAADGQVLAYSADTGESAALVRLARNADLLVCEASFLDGEPNPPDLHLTGRQAAEHAHRAGAGALVLTHLVPWNDQAAVLAEAVPAFGGPVSLARPGATVDLAAPDLVAPIAAADPH
ncbi:MAG: MBL fold metallo-hydrolase [Actinomycetota bacterium]